MDADEVIAYALHCPDCGEEPEALVLPNSAELQCCRTTECANACRAATLQRALEGWNAMCCRVACDHCGAYRGKHPTRHLCDGCSKQETV